jgi:hypothetical protein
MLIFYIFSSSNVTTDFGRLSSNSCISEVMVTLVSDNDIRYPVLKAVVSSL